MKNTSEQIILGIDIKDYSLPAGIDRESYKDKLKQVVSEYFKNKGRDSARFNPTGDGYFIAMDPSIFTLANALDGIAYLIGSFEEVELRYVLNIGNVKFESEINEGKGFDGDVLIETKRILDSISSGNVIFCSKSFYNRYIGLKLVHSKQIKNNGTVHTYHETIITDKHQKQHTAFNISYHKDDIEYGYESTDSTHKEISDSVERKDYETILSFSFPRKQIVHINSYTDIKNRIIYDYFKIEISSYTPEYFLFLNKNVIKTQTIKHFIQNNKIEFPLTICVNKKYLEDDKNDYWKDDFIDKLKRMHQPISKSNNWEFEYLDEFIWKHYFGKDFGGKYIQQEEQAYINPLVEYEEQGLTLQKSDNIDDFLKKWVYKDEIPIQVLVGRGGMGKTTILKRFVNQINKVTSNKVVLYIDASLFNNKRIFNPDVTYETVTSVSDLLTFYFRGVNPDNNLPFIGNKSIADLLISSGNVVIVVDGLDEISHTLKEHFSVNDFISNILNVNSLLNHCKIIFASRDYFWDTSLSMSPVLNKIDYHKIMLRGFNEELARKYFTKTLSSDPSLVAEAFGILKSLGPEKEEHTPFITYLVSEIVKKKNVSNEMLQLDSKYLDKDDVLDNIIAQVFAREQIRQSLDMNIDDFMELFFEILFEHQNQIDGQNFDYYVSNMLPKVKKDNYASLCSNLFLQVGNNKISVKYNYVENHLIVIFLAHEMIQNKTLNKSIYNVLSRYNDGKNDILIDVKNRLEKEKNFEEINKSYFESVLKIITEPTITLNERRLMEKSISSLLYITMYSSFWGNKHTHTEKTSIIKTLLRNKLDNLHIYGDFFPLDFRGLTIKNSSFNNYKNFFKSDFDESTRFVNCRFEFMLSSMDLNSRSLSILRPDNFDKTCTHNDQFFTLIKKINGEQIALINLITGDLKKVLSRFLDRNIAFIPRAETHLETRFDSGFNLYKILTTLRAKGIVEQNSLNQWQIKNQAEKSVSSLLTNNFKDVLIESAVVDLCRINE